MRVAHLRAKPPHRPPLRRRPATAALASQHTPPPPPPPSPSNPPRPPLPYSPAREQLGAVRVGGVGWPVVAGGEGEERIFERFDANGDGRLDRDEMAQLVITANPRRGAGDQISAILDEVFRTYAEFILPDGKGLSLQGLLRTYDDGAGDIDRDEGGEEKYFPGDSRAPTGLILGFGEADA
ncbi:putative TPR repeat-containing protein [Panicum miliaceum]|uniref:TPR repeat-containing protein n=1 Tax=Panicum miliaceum TaxID=4540 RepID=A0A3L6T2G7_PANMI|nr:putative TPR repeat-containing protein [Panicum miliaceum]